MTNTYQNKIEEIKSKDFVVNEINIYKNADKTTNFVTLKGTEKGVSNYIYIKKDGDGNWVEGKPAQLSFFGLPALVDAKRILIVSSEVEVKELYELGLENLAITTTPDMAVKMLDFSVFKDKEVIFLRKNNHAGCDFEDVLIRRLKDFSETIYSVYVEDMDNIKHGDDLLSYFKRNALNTVSEKKAIIDLYVNNTDDLEIVHGSAAYKRRVEDSILGKLRNIPFSKMEKLSNVSNALLPKSVTTTVAKAGSGKTFFNIQNIVGWTVDMGLKVKVLMLEDDQDDHQSRAVAQLYQASGLTNNKVLENNPSFARKAQKDTEARIGIFARAVETVRKGAMTLDQVASWIEDHAENGADIIIIDPISFAAHITDKIWKEDMMFLSRVKQAIRKSGSRVIFFTHPKTGPGGKDVEPSLDGIAGGSAYPRFSHTVIWIQAHDMKEKSMVMQGITPVSVMHKQVFKVLKARNSSVSKGAGIAADLCSDTSAMIELGLISMTKKANAPQAVTDENLELPIIAGDKQLPKKENSTFMDAISQNGGEELPTPKLVDDDVLDDDLIDFGLLERERVQDIDSPMA